MREPHLTPVHRLTASIQLAALVLSLGLQFGVSLCPPGMDRGMDMDMPMVAEAGGVPSDDSAHHNNGSACPFAGSPTQDGGTTCPFALDGIGPCGTTVPAPSAVIASITPARVGQFITLARVSGHTDVPPHVHLPPPRA